MRKDSSRTSQSGPIRRAADGIGALVHRLRDAGLGYTRALYAALGLYLTLSLVAAAIAALGFAEIGEDVLEGDTERFDAVVLERVRSHRSDALDHIALEVTALGSSVVLFVSGVLVSVLLWHLGRRSHVGIVWIAPAGGIVLGYATKLAFGRPRPDLETAVQVGSPSFPSGHAMNSMVFYTVIAYVVGQLVKPGGGRIVVYALGAVVILLVGWTRVYLGVHYPSDVGAGYAVGYFWAVLCIVGVEAWTRRAQKGSPSPR